MERFLQDEESPFSTVALASTVYLNERTLVFVYFDELLHAINYTNINTSIRLSGLDAPSHKITDTRKQYVPVFSKRE